MERLMRGIISLGMMMLGATWMWIFTHISPPPVVHIMGVGLTPCRTWVQARADKSATEGEQWLMGYLSGAGYQEPYPKPAPPPPKRPPAVPVPPQPQKALVDIFGWMDSHCRGAQNQSIAQAADIFLKTHKYR